MRSKAELKTLLQALILIAILVAGSMITSEVSANDGTVCIQRTTAEECRRKVEEFDVLLSESQKVRQQRDEASGARNELRILYFDTLADAQDWEIKAKSAQAAADAAPSRLVWFGAGAAAGVVTTVVVFVLVR